MATSNVPAVTIGKPTGAPIFGMIRIRKRLPGTDGRVREFRGMVPAVGLIALGIALLAAGFSIKILRTV